MLKNDQSFPVKEIYKIGLFLYVFGSAELENRKNLNYPNIGEKCKNAIFLFRTQKSHVLQQIFLINKW